MSLYQHEYAVAIEAVRTAARLTGAVQTGLRPITLEKSDLSPVTTADYGSQAIICRMLARTFPRDPVVAEEDADALTGTAGRGLLETISSLVAAQVGEANADEVAAWINLGRGVGTEERFWTLDPIDGTKGFLRGEHYAVALALIVNGSVEVAALACPNLGADPHRLDPAGSLFGAIRGSGTVRMPLFGEGEGETITVSPTTDAGAAILCESVEGGHSAHDISAAMRARLSLTQPPLRLDSQAKYALVAAGMADVYLRIPPRREYRENIWDHAAGCLVVTEAGGLVTDVAGRPPAFGRGRQLEGHRGLVVTNRRLHQAVLAAVEPLS